MQDKIWASTTSIHTYMYDTYIHTSFSKLLCRGYVCTYMCVFCSYNIYIYIYIYIYTHIYLNSAKCARGGTSIHTYIASLKLRTFRHRHVHACESHACPHAWTCMWLTRITVAGYQACMHIYSRCCPLHEGRASTAHTWIHIQDFLVSVKVKAMIWYIYIRKHSQDQV